MPKVAKPWYRKLIDNLAVKYNKDVRVIEYLTSYPFSFLKQVMRDEKDPRPVWLRHLGVYFLSHPELKDITYVKRMRKMKENMSLLVEAGLFESEEAGFLAIEGMSKEEVNSFYKNKFVRLL